MYGCELIYFEQELYFFVVIIKQKRLLERGFRGQLKVHPMDLNSILLRVSRTRIWSPRIDTFNPTPDIRSLKGNLRVVINLDEELLKSRYQWRRSKMKEAIER